MNNRINIGSNMDQWWIKTKSIWKSNKSQMTPNGRRLFDYYLNQMCNPGLADGLSLWTLVARFRGVSCCQAAVWWPVLRSYQWSSSESFKFKYQYLESDHRRGGSAVTVSVSASESDAGGRGDGSKLAAAMGLYSLQVPCRPPAGPVGHGPVRPGPWPGGQHGIDCHWMPMS